MLPFGGIIRHFLEYRCARKCDAKVAGEYGCVVWAVRVRRLRPAFYASLSGENFQRNINRIGKKKGKSEVYNMSTSFHLGSL
jgi:hypothetical protein